jgi:outer membrane protein assembly factor BamA
MMKAKTCLICFFSFCPFFLTQAQISVFIQCRDETCRDIVDTEISTVAFSQPEARLFLNSIIDKAYSRGYLAAAFDSLVETDTTLHALFRPGPVISFVLTDFGNIQKETLKKAEVKPSPQKPIPAAELYELMNKLLTYYENNGYPFARITIDSVSFINNALQTTLHCEPGMRIRIDTVINKGTLDVHPEVLYSLIGIFPGENYNHSRIISNSDFVRHHRFLRERSVPVVNFSDSGATVIVHLDKRPVNTFDGVIGFMPDYLDEGKLFLTGELMFSLTNSLSLGEKIMLKWRQPQRNSQDLKAGISLPWLVYVPLGCSWDFSLLRKDTLYTSTENKLSLFTAQNPGMKTGAYVHYFSSRSLSATQISEMQGLPAVVDMNITSPGLFIEYNTLDNRTNPGKGLFVKADFSAGKKTVMKNSSVESEFYESITLNSFRIKAETDCSVFIPTGRNAAFQVRNVTGLISSEQLFDNELFMLGGMNNLRGFEENRFYASMFSLQTLEYRLLFEENSRFVVFADAAYVEKQNLNVFQIQRLIGFGAGIVLDTNQGIFSLMYAVGKLQNNPPDFQSSKIHFGYLVVF